MLIWLGKQWLGRTDKQALQHGGPAEGPIELSTDHLRERLAGTPGTVREGTARR
jgi:hypothetical protein